MFLKAHCLKKKTSIVVAAVYFNPTSFEKVHVNGIFLMKGLFRFKDQGPVGQSPVKLIVD